MALAANIDPGRTSIELERFWPLLLSDEGFGRIECLFDLWGRIWPGHKERAARRARRKTSQPDSIKGSNPGRAKRRTAPTVVRSKHSPVSGLGKELNEACEQQIATSEILKGIARSPSNSTPAFEAIASSTKQLLGAFARAVFRLFDGAIHLAAFTPESGRPRGTQGRFPQSTDDAAFRPTYVGKPFAISDTEETQHAPVGQVARQHGFHSMLCWCLSPNST